MARVLAVVGGWGVLCETEAIAEPTTAVTQERPWRVER